MRPLMMRTSRCFGFRRYVREVIYFEVYFYIDDFSLEPIETVKDPTL